MAVRMLREKILFLIFEKDKEFQKNILTSGIKANKIKKRLILLHLLNQINITSVIPKVSNYCTTVKTFSDDVFYTHFRMRRDVFEKLISVLEPFWAVGTGHPITSLEESLLITLWAVANQTCFRDLSDRFNKSKSTIHSIFFTMCKLITRNLTKHYVRWPTTPEDINKRGEEFATLRARGFPNVIGSIDGTHIKIKAPTEDTISYYNRKGVHSIIVQAVATSDGSFSNVFCGWPGSSHDVHVFKNSPLGISLLTEQIRLPSDLVGDSAYPLLNFLMVPYKNNGYLTAAQKMYNRELSSTRVIVEQSFGILKKKFRILNELNFRHLSNIKYVVLTCFVLSKEGKENIKICEIELENSEKINDRNERDDNNGNARTKRDLICNLISG